MISGLGVSVILAVVQVFVIPILFSRLKIRFPHGMRFALCSGIQEVRDSSGEPWSQTAGLIRTASASERLSADG